MSQRKLRRSLSALVLLAVAAVTLAAGYKVRHKVPRRGSLVQIGQPLPSLVVFDRDGKRFDLSTMDEGKRRVIVFYSPTCEVCKQELPELTPFPSELTAIYVKESDAPSADPFGVTGNAMDRLTDRESVLKRAFVMPGLPTMLFIDEHGIVRDGLVGAHAAGFAHKKLEQFAHARV
ncbi:MAG TPA: redoxin domain-containing protein [Thermoanaerobaculia bacterium]|nr:redoxin domain-containing protein [Thermoanaerobaculia bacterium]